MLLLRNNNKNIFVHICNGGGGVVENKEGEVLTRGRISSD